MILALCCGAGVGGGLFFVFRGLYPPRPSLAQALAQLRLVPEPAPVLAPEADSGFAARLGRPAARVLHRSGAGWLIPQRVRRDLAVLDRSPERHLAEKLTLALVGLLFAPAITALSVVGRGAPFPHRAVVGVTHLDGRRVRPSRPRHPRRRGTPSAGLPPRPRLVPRPGRRRVGRRWRGRDRARRCGEHRQQLGVRLDTPGTRRRTPRPRDPVVSPREAGPRARDR